MKLSEFRRWLRERGWKLRDGAGRHEHWVAPNGAVMPVHRGTHQLEGRKLLNMRTQVLRLERGVCLRHNQETA